MNKVKKTISAFLAFSITAGFAVYPALAENREYTLTDEVLSSIVYLGNSEQSVPADENNVANKNEILSMQYVDENGQPVEKPLGVKPGIVTFSDTLPAAYDLREQRNANGESLSTSPKHQDYSNYCWAFSAMASAESNILKKNIDIPDRWRDPEYGNELALSPTHLGYFAFDEAVGTDGLEGDYMAMSYHGSKGGNSFVTATALSTGAGVQLFQETPLILSDYGIGDEQRFSSYYDIKNFDSVNCDYKNPYSAENKELIKTVKNWLMNNGACVVSYYPGELYTSPDGVSSYYSGSPETLGIASHASTIIGWNDDFSNFDPENPPEENGAWLIKDTYGDSRGKGGYFWLSYYNNNITSIDNFTMEAGDYYDNIYQYCGAIPNSEIPVQRSANVFTAKGSEALKAVSFMTYNNNLDYTVRVYSNLADSDDPESGTLSSEKSGRFAYGGYHTIDLDNTLSLSAGERFSVVFELSDSDTGKISAIPIEMGGFDFFSEIAMNYSSLPGQSYIYSTDAGTMTDKWMDVKKIKGGFGNVMIKAMTSKTDTSTDKSTLEKAIERADNAVIDRAGATPAYLSIYDRDIAQAREVLNDNSAKQYEIDNVQKNLDSVLTMLEKPNELHISTADEFYKFMEAYNNREIGYIQRIYLDNDIALNPPEIFVDNDNDGYKEDVADGAKLKLITPIGDFYEPFRATFDGQGHSISGMVAAGNHYQGLFGQLVGTVQNLTIKDSIIQATTSYCGAIAGITQYGSQIINCNSINNVIGYPDSAAVGGVTGYVSDDVSFNSPQNMLVMAPPKIENCHVTNSLITGSSSVGGVIGRVAYVSDEPSTFNTISFTGAIESQLKNSDFGCIGLLIGSRTGADLSEFPYYTAMLDTDKTQMRLHVDTPDGKTMSGWLMEEPLDGTKRLTDIRSSSGISLTSESIDGKTLYTFTEEPVWTKDETFITNFETIPAAIDYNPQTDTVIISTTPALSGAELIMASYASDGSLLQVYRQPVYLQENSTAAYSTEQWMTKDEGVTVKIMLLDSFASMTPLALFAEL